MLAISAPPSSLTALVSPSVRQRGPQSGSRSRRTARRGPSTRASTRGVRAPSTWRTCFRRFCGLACCSLAEMRHTLPAEPLDTPSLVWDARLGPRGTTSQARAALARSAARRRARAGSGTATASWTRSPSSGRRPRTRRSLAIRVGRSRLGLGHIERAALTAEVEASSNRLLAFIGGSIHGHGSGKATGWVLPSSRRTS